MDAGEELVAELSKLGYGREADSSRLLGMVMALAGEVFVMKAQNERLRRALETRGALEEADLLDAQRSDGMKDWLATEEREFTRAVLMPFLAGDGSVNATAAMAGRGESS